MGKYKLVCTDIHDTILPGDYATCLTEDFKTSYFGDRFKEFVKLIKSQNIKLVFVTSGTIEEAIFAIKCSKFHENLPVQIIVENSLLHSTDGGNTWQTIPSPRHDYALPTFKSLFKPINALESQVDGLIVEVIFNNSYLTICAQFKEGDYQKVYGLIKSTVEGSSETIKYTIYNIVVKPTRVVLHVVLANATKVAGIQYLQEKYNCKDSEVLFYGNGENDYEALTTYDSILSKYDQLYNPQIKKQILDRCLKHTELQYYNALIEFLK